VKELIANRDSHLLKVIREQVITGNPIKLKITALKLSRYSLRVEEPGGDESVVRHDAAVLCDQAAVGWLLTYNQNDEKATEVLRLWLGTEASSLASVEMPEP
jgi:predicted RecB family nuclease